MAEANDLLMKFVDSKGETVKGESGTDLTVQPSAMTKGFEAGKMLEITSFSFAAGLQSDDQDETATMLSNFMESQNALAAKFGARVVKPPKSTRARQYTKFYDREAHEYPVDINPIQVKRFIDRSSSDLLQNCIRREVYKSASVIKRRAAGGPNSGEVFLRFDFTQVLMINVDWDNDDPIQETYTFVCRGISIRYLPQLPDGSLGAPVQATWKANSSVELVTT